MKIIIDNGAYMPIRAHKDDAGLDLRTPKEVIVPAHGSSEIDTGVHVCLPKRTAGFLKSKSGLNVKYGITCEGVIDAGYSGSIHAKLYNHSDTDHVFFSGDKIVQLVILPVVIPKRLKVVNAFKKTKRGNGGFGSSGR
jgi:dUTP pyrophosphatase